MARLKPRQQGDIGELSAMEWLASKGAHIYVPVGHSPDIDLIAQIDGVALRIEVKTTTRRNARGGWNAMISTRGGNQSWTGLAKYFDPSRCDYLFIHVGDGRRWCIPSAAIEARTGLVLGGPKYSEFEIDQGRPLISPTETAGLESRPAGGVPKRSNGAPCKGAGSAFGGSNPPSPISSHRRIRPTNYERKSGQRGEAVINQKRRLTIPQRPFFEAGFANGGRVRVKADGPGRLVVEQIELPAWARRKQARAGAGPEAGPD
jgi:Holliday junction resolvase-like predicted endonuclease